LSITSARAAPQFNVEQYHAQQALEDFEERIATCVFEAAQVGLVTTKSVRGAVNLAAKICNGGVHQLLEMAHVPPEAQREIGIKWLYPILKLALASFNQGLTDDWPDEMPARDSEKGVEIFGPPAAPRATDCVPIPGMTPRDTPYCRGKFEQK